MKGFETVIANEWRGWQANEDTIITKKANIVTIVLTLKDKEPFKRAKMVFNLNTLPVYSVLD